MNMSPPPNYRACYGTVSCFNVIKLYVLKHYLKCMKLFFSDIQATVDVMEVMSVLRTNVSGCSPLYGGRNMSGEANPGGT